MFDREEISAALALAVCAVADVAGIAGVALSAAEEFHVSVFSDFEFRSFHFRFFWLGLLGLAHYVSTISAYGESVNRNRAIFAFIFGLRKCLIIRRMPNNQMQRTGAGARSSGGFWRGWHHGFSRSGR